MRGGKQNTAGRVKRAYTKRARPQQPQQVQPQQQQPKQLPSYQPAHPVHITPVVDDQQVGHLPLPQPIYSDVSELQDRVNDLGDAWEAESIFEDIIDDLTHDTFPHEGR
jgi:hypothetical protein